MPGPASPASAVLRPARRSEKGRVGEEGRSRGAPYHLKKKTNQGNLCAPCSRSGEQFNCSSTETAGARSLYVLYTDVGARSFKPTRDRRIEAAYDSGCAI